jgi:hypothetical protein
MRNITKMKKEDWERMERESGRRGWKERGERKA